MRPLIIILIQTSQEYQKGIQVGDSGPKDPHAASHKIVHNYKTLRKMLETIGFEMKLPQYCDEKKNSHYNEWDRINGIICRPKKYDPRNQGDKLVFPSLIIDAIKS
ncbi:SAM-dependent methyltransferase [Bacillus wiedmannii bv. thuringiensis]|nr:SAM-dependent methyltransferase [Bacillus wiedmannii bv. thuringiensis]